ncbi:MAG: dipeptidyl-peptidase 5 [Wenzhouxiangella sp.]
MPRIRAAGVLLAFVFLSASALASSDLRPITHEDLWLMPRVGTPALSPDGRLAVVSVMNPAYDAADAESNLWLIHVDGSEEPRQITFSTGVEAHVAWSPDSRRIAFSARRDGDAVAQIHLLDLVGGGEARPVTSISTGARRPVFSPDGQRIAFTSNVHRDAVNDADSRRIQEEEAARRHNVMTFTGFPIRNWNRWLDERQPRLFVQTIGEAEAVDLLAGSALLASPGFDGARTAGGSELNPVWTPDGEGLVFVASRNRDRFAFDFTHDDLWLVPASGGEPRRLTGQDSPESDDSWNNPSFSPDGQTLLATRFPRTEWVYNATRLALIDWPAARQRSEITLPDRRAIGEFAVDPNTGQVLILAEDSGLVRFFAGSLDGGEARPSFDQSAGMYAGLSIARSGEDLIILASYQDSAQPAEVVQVDLAAGEHQALTRFTADRVAELDLVPAEHFWFESERGARIHNMLIRPAGFDPNRQYPLAVIIKGGPHTMFRDQFFLRWNYHLLARRDFVILLTNYTGSTGFGEDFARGIQFDPLRGPADELNQAADAAIERFSFIDPDRQCAGGASYGGHLTNWLLGNTDRYRCLISHAGLVNLITQWGTSDVIFHREVNVGGPPWEIPEVWLDQNPLMYAENWSTPILVTIGKRDERVPLANVLEFWSALQRQQVESRLLVYPDEDHWIMNGHNSRHFYDEIDAWLRRWLLDD